jgi:hypothetical protein
LSLAIVDTILFVPSVMRLPYRGVGHYESGNEPVNDSALVGRRQTRFDVA